MLIDDRVKLVVGNRAADTDATFNNINGSPSTGGFINFEEMVDQTLGAAITNGEEVPYCASVDSLAEAGFCTVNLITHKINRPTNGNMSWNTSGTHDRLDFSGASAAPTVTVGWPALLAQSMYNAIRPTIYGLELSSPSNTTLAASAGCCFIEGSRAAPMKAAALATISPTLAADTWYNAFTAVSGGALILESVSGGSTGSTNPPAPFSIPAGQARSKSGDTTRRYVAPYRTDGAAHIRPFRTRDLGGGLLEVLYLTASLGAPFQVLSGGSATSLTAIDLSAVIPNNGTAVEALLSYQAVSTSGHAAEIVFGVDATNAIALVDNPSTAASASGTPSWMHINATTNTGIYYFVTDALAQAAVYCSGYRIRR